MSTDLDPRAPDPRPTVDGDAVRFLPTTAMSLEDIAALFNRGFEDYLVPIRMTADGLSQMIRADSIDLAASKVLVEGGAAAGFILVCTRGWTRRVSAMGVIASGRGRGLGRLLMEHVIGEATRRGFHRLVLEVIEQNTSALTLYRHLGFQETRRLVGYECPPFDGDDGDPVDELKPLDPRELAKIIEYEAPPDLPWQLAAETVAAAGPPAQALRLEDRAYALVHGTDGDEATLATLIVPHAVRRRGWGRRMVRGIRARFPHCAWRVPARFPENLAAGFFDHVGFRRIPLSQYEMVRDLDGSES